MATSYEKNKKHIMKWRRNNLERLRELNRDYKRKVRKADAYSEVSKCLLRLLRNLT